MSQEVLVQHHTNATQRIEEEQKCRLEQPAKIPLPTSPTPLACAGHLADRHSYRQRQEQSMLGPKGGTSKERAGLLLLVTAARARRSMRPQRPFIPLGIAPGAVRAQGWALHRCTKAGKAGGAAGCFRAKAFYMHMHRNRKLAFNLLSRAQHKD
eukprot:1145631-Pelagomonas_calceolata.AAC.2